MQTISADKQNQKQLSENQLVEVKKEMRNYEHIQIIEKVGQGSFGDIFKVWDNKRSGWAAIKFEKKDKKNKFSLIQKEAQIMQAVKGFKYFAVLFDSRFIDSSQYNFIEMSFLGPNLESLKKRMEGKFSEKTVLLMANQMISGLEVLHTKGIIHRDIKPENFVIGCEGQHHQVYVIDFGLSKYYIEENGKHIEQKTNKGLVGTARYTSVNSHLGIEQSRRDDLESLAYLLLYFIKGHLIWQNLQVKDKDERFKKISQLKQTTSIDQMCEGLPKPFNQFLSAVKSLRFDQEPDYERYRQLFSNYYSKYYIISDLNPCYDWCPKKCSLNLKSFGRGESKNLSETVSNGTTKSKQFIKQFSDSKPIHDQIISTGNQNMSVGALKLKQIGASNPTLDVTPLEKTQLTPLLNNSEKLNYSQIFAQVQIQKTSGIDQNGNEIAAVKEVNMNNKESSQIGQQEKFNEIDNKVEIKQQKQNFIDEIDDALVSEFGREEECKKIPIFKTGDNYSNHNLLFSVTNKGECQTNGFGSQVQKLNSRNELDQSISIGGKLKNHLIAKSCHTFNLPSPNYLSLKPYSRGTIENNDNSKYVNNLSNEWNSLQDEKVSIQKILPFNSSHNQQQF